MTKAKFQDKNQNLDFSSQNFDLTSAKKKLNPGVVVL